MSDKPAVCDYEDSTYRTSFWEKGGRGYEDRVERIALRRLMPPAGDTLIEVGAGFGRLADEYSGYDKVVLFDYSRSLLREGQELLRDDPRYIFVAGNWYEMPFVDGVFNTLVQIRTMHHAQDVPALLAELARISKPNGRYILEFANKQNIKAVLRYALRKQTWSPFAPEPIEFVTLNYNFQPKWMLAKLADAGFRSGRKLTVSHFRIGPVKRVVPTNVLAALDSVAQLTGDWWQLAPSVFVYNHAPSRGNLAADGTLFACPKCRTPLHDDIPHGGSGTLSCSNFACEAQWSVTDGLYDFKEPVNA